jgi:ferrochelatase
MPYLPEPPFRHDSPRALGILLINLGTPEAPTKQALRPYLKQFLSDPRVVEIPRPIWWPILNGIILNTRPAKSAEKYASIWSVEGSPLMAHTKTQAKLLEGWLRDRIPQPFAVRFAMRYGEPSVALAIAELKAAGCERILAVPLYPQYAASSTASACDAVFDALRQTRNMPELRTVRSFHDHPGYIDALAASVREHWQAHGQAEVLVMSFHGVPRFALDKGDPYHCQCQKTGRLLIEALGLPAARYRLAFQSRFGRTEWLKPYTSDVLAELGRAKTASVDVICPGFVADCLETLEEIAMEGKASFLSSGGGTFRYIPALNERHDWISALTELAIDHLQGWLDPAYRAPSAEEAARACLVRARLLGAKS